MKHTKTLVLSLSIMTTCYIAYFSVQRNTLAPIAPLSSLSAGIPETNSPESGLAADVINDLAHRMTQQPSLKTYSTEHAINEINKGTIHCAIIPHEVAAKKTNSFFVIPILKHSSHKSALIISHTHPELLKRTEATLLEMKEDGTLDDFAHKWNLV
ncbi:MAG: hypothetical protein ACJAZS_000646 [Alteromonas naphthalenivorans]|jgi:hypothetical protein